MIKKIILSFVFALALFSGFAISAKPVSAVGCDFRSINSFTVFPTIGSVGTTVTISWDVKPGCQDGVLEIAPGNIVVANQPSGSYTHVLTGPPETYYLSVCDGTVPGNGFGKCEAPYYYSGMVADDFAQVTVGASLLPATLTVNVVDKNDSPLSGASWTLFGGSPNPYPSFGGGTSMSHTIYPSSGGDTVTLYNYPSQINNGDTLSITNSDSGGPSIFMLPGQSKWIQLKYSQQVPDCTVSLNTSSNSIVNGNSATLTWSSTNTVSPFTTGTNFNTANAQANMIGVSVSPSVTTTYTITGYGGNGCSASQTITVTAPPAPVILVFTATPSCNVSNVSEILLSWWAINATSYTVQRNNSGGATIYSGSGTSFTDSSRTALQTYTYYLTATGPGGSVNQTTSATAQNCAVPTPPVMISVTPTPICSGTTPQMQLTWSASNSPTSYLVQRNNSSGATVYSGSGTSFVDSPLSQSTPYTYYVTATNADGTSAPGMTASGTTGSCVGSSPTVSIGASPNPVSSGQSTTLTWTIGGGSAQSCTASSINGQWSGALSAGNITPGTHTQIITNLTTSTTFSISCLNASGSNSSSVGVTVSGGSTPVATLSSSQTNVSSGSFVTLSWTATNSPTSCSGSWGPVAPPSYSSGSQSIQMFSTATFTYQCSNGSGPGNIASVTVTVGGGGLPDYSTTQPATISLIANDPNSRITGSMYNLTPNPGGGGNYVFQVATAANGGGVVTTLAPSPFTSMPANYSNYEGFTKVYTFPSVGTYSRRICVDGTGFSTTGPNPSPTGGVVTESDETNNCSPWGTVNVTSGTMDVVAGPTYTTTWTSVNGAQSWWYFGAWIKNQGTGATPGSGFPTIGQLATQPNGGGTITNFNYYFSSAIAPGAQWGAAYASGYPFSSPGTYSTRACADATGVSGNTATGGVLAESDETNNCGPWTDLVVTLNPTTAPTIIVQSNRPSSWDVVPLGGPAASPVAGSGTQTTHTLPPNTFALYTLGNIQNITGYTYTVMPSTPQFVYTGSTLSFYINYTSTSSFDYSLSSNGAISATKSAVPVNVQSTITKTLVTGVTQAVDVTATGMPAGVSVAYANRSCSPTCTSTITFTVDPSAAAGTYPITVTGTSAATSDKTTTFNLTINNPVVLSVTCTPSPSPAYVGQPVTWTGTIVGGTGPYTYAWTGSDFGTGSTNPFVFTYQSTGTKNAVLTATDSLSASGSCPATNLGVTIDPKYKEF